jgi:hypothetical protein
VSYDSSLGSNGASIAEEVLASCEGDYYIISGYFGDIIPPDLPFRIIIENFSWGGYHTTSTPGEIHLGVDLGPPVNPRFTQIVNVAEFVETFALGLNRGWSPGASNGEALSRVLSAELYPDQLDGFATAWAWIAAGRPDYVTQTEGTDGDPISIGCGAVFLNFLSYYLGYEWRPIVLAGGDTLAQTYERLTNRTDAFSRFLDAVATYPDPADDSDNPFPNLRIATVGELAAAGAL